MNSATTGAGPFQIYQDALARGEFLIQQCRDCGQHVFYPRALCNHCGSVDLKWVPAVGRGAIYSTTIVRRRPEKGGDYNVALITLEEGPRMLSRVIGIDPEEVKIGAEVISHITLIEGKPAVIFTIKSDEKDEW